MPQGFTDPQIPANNAAPAAPPHAKKAQVHANVKKASGAQNAKGLVLISAWTVTLTPEIV